MKKPLNTSLLALAGLALAAVVACTGVNEIKVGELVSGTITSSDDDDETWKSKTYVIDVREGARYFIDLTSPEGSIVGIWSADAGDYIVEVSPTVRNRSVPYTFSKGGRQELLLQSPAPNVPSPFTFRVWTP